MQDSEASDEIVARLQRLCAELRTNELELLATPLGYDALCTVCGRLLTVAYHDRKPFDCRFCPRCFDKLTKSGRQTRRCLEHEDHRITKDFLLSDVSGNLTAVLFRCPHQCGRLFGLRRVWEHQEKCPENGRRPATEKKDHSAQNSTSDDDKSLMQRVKEEVDEESEWAARELREARLEQLTLEKDLDGVKRKIQRLAGSVNRSPGLGFPSEPTTTDLDRPRETDPPGEALSSYPARTGRSVSSGDPTDGGGRGLCMADRGPNTGSVFEGPAGHSRESDGKGIDPRGSASVGPVTEERTAMETHL